MQHILFFTFLVAAAAAFAALEVQIEGDAGWAASLPTWRLTAPWARRLMGGRPLTGYHVYCHLFVAIMTHVPYGLGQTAISLAAEARIVAFLLLFWIVEDFLWFVINPAYRLNGFNRDRATWHAPSWWWIMPREYWIFAPVALALYAWSQYN